MSKNTVASSKRPAVAALLAGFNKHLASQGSLKLGNATFTAAEVTKALQAFVDAFDANVAEEAKAKSTHQAAVSADVAVTPLVKLLVAFVRAVFGSDAQVLSDFGLAPHKAKTTKPAVLVQAAKKATATRAARHTMGSKQKKGVTGQTVTQSNGQLAPKPAS